MTAPERIPCLTPGCKYTILPSTAAETGGYCQPCIQEQRRKAHNEYVLANRKDVDPYAGLVSPVDIILAFHAKRPYNELIRYAPLQRPLASIFAELSPQDIERLIDQVVLWTKPGHDSAREQLLIELAAYTSANLDRALMALITQGEFYPGMAFHRAGPQVRSALLAATENKHSRALDALAWVDHPEARDRFARWRDHPPSYQAQLYVAASSYSEIGGWKIEADGSSRRLYLESCWALVPPSTEALESESCRIGVTTEQPCPQCGRALTDLLVLDRSDARLGSIPWPNRRLHLRTCLSDRCFAPVFFDHSRSGPPVWLGEIDPKQAPKDAEWSAVPSGSLVLDDHPRAILHGASDNLPDPLSQIGGLPAWVQDSDYLSCPKCAKAMTFIAQISVADVHQHGDGIFYALVCPGCQVTGTTYQQT